MPGILIENNSVNGENNYAGIFSLISYHGFVSTIKVRNNVVIGCCTEGNYLYEGFNGSSDIIMNNNASEDDSLPIDEEAPPAHVTRDKNFNNIDREAEFLSTTIEEYPDLLTSDYFKIKLGTASITVNPEKGAVPLDVIMTPSALVNILADHGYSNVAAENYRDLNGIPRPNVRGRISMGVYEP